MSKENAVQTITDIYNILQAIPVSGEQNILVMSSVFQALKELLKWADLVAEDGDKQSDGAIS